MLLETRHILVEQCIFKHHSFGKKDLLQEMLH